MKKTNSNPQKKIFRNMFLVLTTMIVGVSFALFDIQAKDKSGENAEVLGALIKTNDHEIEVAKAVYSRTVPAEVLDFAKMMDSQHSQNNEKTREVAKNIHLTPAYTSEVKSQEAKGKADLEKLKALDDKAFFKAYMDAMVNGHKAVLAKIDQEYLKKASNEQLRAHLVETRHHVEMHLEKAKEVSAKL